MTTSEIQALLKSRKTEDRLRAVQVMARRKEPGDADRLIASLADRSSYVAQLAAEALSGFAQTEHGAALVAAFERIQAKGPEADRGCYIRTALAYALARLEHYPADDILRTGLRTVQIEAVGGVPTDTACQLRAACALALAEIRASNALMDIAPLLFDETLRIDCPAPLAVRNSGVRKSAAQALARLGDRGALVVLAVKLMFPKGEEGDILVECMEAALVLDPAKAAELIRPYLTRGNGQLIAQAATVYARTEAPDAAEQVAEAAGRVSGDNLRAVILTLASMRTADAFEKLYAFAGSPREQERLAFVEAVGVTGDPHARPLLEALAANDGSARVREAARRAMAPDTPTGA